MQANEAINTEQSIPAAVNFVTLPAEILFEISKYLHVRELLKFSEVNTNLQSIAYSDLLWKQMLMQDFPPQSRDLENQSRGEKQSFYFQYRKAYTFADWITLKSIIFDGNIPAFSLILNSPLFSANFGRVFTDLLKPWGLCKDDVNMIAPYRKMIELLLAHKSAESYVFTSPIFRTAINNNDSQLIELLLDTRFHLNIEMFAYNWMSVEDFATRNDNVDLIKNILLQRIIRYKKSPVAYMWIYLDHNDYIRIATSYNGKESIAQILNCHQRFSTAIQLLIKGINLTRCNLMLILSRMHDPNFFDQLLDYFLKYNQLSDHEKQKFYSLKLVKAYKKMDIMNIISRSSPISEFIYFNNQLKNENQIQSILDKKEALHCEVGINDLLNKYNELIKLQIQQIKNIKQLLSYKHYWRINEKLQIELTESQRWMIEQFDIDINNAFSTIENKLLSVNSEDKSFKILMAFYRPITKNLSFFSNYLNEATFKKQHNIARVAYCLYFVQKMSIKFKTREDNIQDPTDVKCGEPTANSNSLLFESQVSSNVDLLQNLYRLKGLLLAEVHSQKYLDMLFNCAMTSRLAKHVETEIVALEEMLNNSYTAKDCKMEIEKTIRDQREKIAKLDQAYGSAWRRFKSKLLGYIPGGLESKETQELVKERQKALDNTIDPFFYHYPLSFYK